MKYLESFDDRFSRKSQPDISTYSRGGRCRSKCDREILKTKEGTKMVCHGCKRIIREINKDSLNSNTNSS